MREHIRLCLIVVGCASVRDSPKMIGRENVKVLFVVILARCRTALVAVDEVVPKWRRSIRKTAKFLFSHRRQLTLHQAHKGDRPGLLVRDTARSGSGRFGRGGSHGDNGMTRTAGSCHVLRQMGCSGVRITRLLS
jgi:hypothetical protein